MLITTGRANRNLGVYAEFCRMNRCFPSGKRETVLGQEIPSAKARRRGVLGVQRSRLLISPTKKRPLS